MRLYVMSAATIFIPSKSNAYSLPQIYFARPCIRKSTRALPRLSSTNQDNDEPIPPDADDIINDQGDLDELNINLDPNLWIESRESLYTYDNEWDKSDGSSWSIFDNIDTTSSSDEDDNSSLTSSPSSSSSSSSSELTFGCRKTRNF